MYVSDSAEPNAFGAAVFRMGTRAGEQLKLL